jgi:hypothetical protein
MTTTVTWKYSDGTSESFTAICIRDARELWDRLYAVGCNLTSVRP